MSRMSLISLDSSLYIYAPLFDSLWVVFVDAADQVEEVGVGAASVPGEGVLDAAEAGDVFGQELGADLGHEADGYLFLPEAGDDEFSVGWGHLANLVTTRWGLTVRIRKG
jgi:hypothetical protein